MYPVSSVKERNRKGGKCKISRVLQSPVSNPQASSKVEASNRLKQAQHFSTHRKVQNGNSRVHQDPPDSRGMGIVALFFIAKNQLAREGSQSVSPVTIPALTTIVDRRFKEDRTLCPVRALRYYLD